MTDIEDALHLAEQLGLIIKIWIFPIDRMARWRLQAAFSSGHNEVKI
jgi:hypothetical protein